MKKAFKVCYLAGLTYDDDTSRKRCELYKELQDKNARDTALLWCVGVDRSLNNPQQYPDYYQLIKQPVALSALRNRLSIASKMS